MSLAEVVRFVILVLAGAATGLMVATNVVAFFVLRPPRRLGFLWMHVSAISLATMGLLLIAVNRVVTRLDEPPSWQTWVILGSVLLLTVAQVLIFRVERQRYAEKIAANGHPH